MLASYATRFNAVEINSSFYRPHQRKTYERWAATVPAPFRFAVKLPQAISHEHALRRCGPLLDAFFGQVEGLGGKLGVLLLQLPPGLAFEARVASAFLRLLRAGSDVAVACEPRHASWFSARAEALLAQHAVARVAADPARLPAAALPGGDTGWQYWRWHGSPRMYYSEYSPEAITQLAEQVRAHARRRRPWVIFDNTAHGFAVSDAARMQAALGASPFSLREKVARSAG